jgi:DNA-binding transcriptional LysR family regulator
MAQYPLYDETYYLVSPASAGKSDTRPISWRNAAKEPLALLSPQMLNRKLIDDVFRKLGEKPLIRLEGDSILSLLTHVENGLCSAIVPRSSLSALPGIGGMSVRQLVDPVVSHPVGLVMLREVANTPGGQRLDALVRSPKVRERSSASARLRAVEPNSSVSEVPGAGCDQGT